MDTLLVGLVHMAQTPGADSAGTASEAGETKAWLLYALTEFATHSPTIQDH
jgi:hypothetical protein